jgi:hypothetical protein
VSARWIAIGCFVVGCGGAPHRSEPGPSLPLPEVTPENAALPLKSGRPIANSLRAWHYKPAIVKPLAALVDATLDGSRLPDRMLDALVVVVASRNRCFY